MTLIENYRELFSILIEMHFKLKKLNILSEEISIDFKSFRLPSQEIVHANEHIMRTFASELGLITDTTTMPNYIEDNLKKAIAHYYRAIFDSLDYISIILRSKIVNVLNQYPPNVIMHVLPDYYTTIRPAIMNLTIDINELRASKDLSDIKSVSSKVDKYIEIIDKILVFHRKLEASLPDFNNLIRETKYNKVKSQIFIALISILFASLSTWLVISFLSP